MQVYAHNIPLALIMGFSMLIISCGDFQDPAPPGTSSAAMQGAQHGGGDASTTDKGGSPQAAPLGMTKSVTLDWDGSRSADVLGYKVYLVEQSTATQQIIDAGLTTELPVQLRVGETYAFTVTAYNASGESLPPPLLYFSLS